MSKPIAYCVDLDEDALIKASKSLGLEPTEENFLNTPLYAHPMRELSDDEIDNVLTPFMKYRFHHCGNTSYVIPDVDYEGFARAIIKASRGEK